MIDVIIPVYNVKLYLEKCLDSVINQKFDQINIIIVDDGSTDGSSNICDSYQKKDSRILVIHQQNKGLANARNTGLKYSKAKYVSFIDSDDFLEPDFLSYLYSNIIKFHADISICSYQLSTKKKEQIQEKVTITDSYSALKLMSACDYKYSFVAWNKLYKRELFKSNLFPNGKLYEDLVPITNAVIKSNKIVFSNFKKYHYLNVRKSSICNQQFSVKEYDRIEQVKILNIIISQKMPKLKKHFLIFTILNYIYVCDKLLLANDNKNKFINETNKLIKKNILNILFSDYLMRRKIQIFIFYLNKKLYYQFIRGKYGN